MNYYCIKVVFSFKKLYYLFVQNKWFKTLSEWKCKNSIASVAAESNYDCSNENTTCVEFKLEAKYKGEDDFIYKCMPGKPAG